MEISSNLSAKTRLYVVIAIVGFFITGLFCLGTIGMEIISGLRAYVGSEGLYSKSQKSASFHLLSYSHTRDAKAYEEFERDLEIPLGYKRARLELEKTEPDLEIAYKGFIQGRAHHRDVKIMAMLFRWFRDFEYIDKAIDVWARGDSKITEFQTLGIEIHQRIAEDLASDKEINTFVTRIESINLELNDLEDEFSYTMGEASRWAKGLLVKVIASFAIVAVVICLGLLLFVGKIIANMQKYSKDLATQNWLKTSISELSDKMRGERDPGELGNIILAYLVHYTGARIGVMYITERRERLKMVSNYACDKRKNLPDEFSFGEGIVGQAALEKQRIIITNAPDDYIKVTSGLGEAVPRNIMVNPILFENKVIGVLELGSFNEFNEHQMNFLDLVMENIGVSLNAASARIRLKNLLEQTQTQAGALQEQQEELKTTNEELEEQAAALRASEAKLQTQQEELEQTNEELEEQQTKLEEKNKDVEKARSELEIKSEELALTSKYKSEFLANMSHELRTPLNSMLILSKLLVENKEGNLNEKQKEYAETVNQAGSELLVLINEVLDLSKIEAGKLEINTEEVSLDSLATYVQKSFQNVVKDKGLYLNVNLDKELPHIYTDRQRVEQIIRNLISNAVKFTSKGGITVSIDRPGPDARFFYSGMKHESTVAISVSDTGIGISEEKQRLIFEAFQQADGGTSRKFGGTGLGLTISRELVSLLKGEITVQSEAGKGSTFTLYIAEKIQPHETSDKISYAKGNGAETEIPPAGSQQEIQTGMKPFEQMALANVMDDRRDISPQDKSVLIVEDDPRFAKILMELAHEKGFKGLIAGDGKTGLSLADYYKPSSIILDIRLPDIDGWSVMEQLKNNPGTRHIPIHIMSAEDRPMDAMKMGAIGFLNKPVDTAKLEGAFQKIESHITRVVKKLLVLESDASERKHIVELIGNGKVLTSAVGTCKEAYDLIKSDRFDCMILDLDLPDMPGIRFLEKLRNDESIIRPPAIVYTGRDLSKQEDDDLRQYAEKVVVKNPQSHARLLDETTLFLHLVASEMPQEKQEMLQMVHNKEKIFQDKKVLIVDDDMRNVFALSSALEEKGMQVMAAKNGAEGLECINKNSSLDLVLMDIMMPEMDGYEAMQEIRKQERFIDLPVIALTAKAMQGDREKCIKAGANDYISKPVDKERLLSVMRVWLYQ